MEYMSPNTTLLKKIDICIEHVWAYLSHGNQPLRVWISKQSQSIDNVE